MIKKIPKGMNKQTLCSTVIKNLSGYERLRLNVEFNSNSGGQVLIRSVESESLNVGKSLKVRQSRIKSEKSDLISY